MGEGWERPEAERELLPADRGADARAGRLRGRQAQRPPARQAGGGGRRTRSSWSRPATWSRSCARSRTTTRSSGSPPPPSSPTRSTAGRSSAGLAGRSEREVARAAEARIRELGAEPSFPPIVAAGANGALPHAEPGEREIGEGELVVFDMGAELDGYCSDCTRTFATGEPGDEAREVYELVRDAQAAALEAVRPGISRPRGRRRRARADRRRPATASASATASATASASRSTRARASRPPPRTSCAEGNVVTVEPGVYVPGSFGVRIEDLVVVTEDGHRNLSGLPKELTLVELTRSRVPSTRAAWEVVRSAGRGRESAAVAVAGRAGVARRAVAQPRRWAARPAGPRGSGRRRLRACPGADRRRRSTPHRPSITGSFSTATEGGYVYSPSTCRPGPPPSGSATATTSPRRAADAAARTRPSTSLDLGLYDARPGAGVLGARASSAAGAGSSIRDVTVSPNGFSTEARPTSAPQATPPRPHHPRLRARADPGRASGRSSSGVAAVASQRGRRDRRGRLARRDRPLDRLALEQRPYAPSPPITTRRRPTPIPAGTRATSTSTASTSPATRPCARPSTTPSRPSGRAEAPGSTSSRSSTTTTSAPTTRSAATSRSHHPGKLIVRSTEVTTYRGHLQNHASGDFVRLPDRAAARGDAGRRRRDQPHPRPLNRGRDPRPASDDLRRDPRRRRLHPDQPPDDLPVGGADLRRLLPRLPLGLLGRRDRLLEGGRDRDRDRPGRASQAPPFPGPNPFTPLAIQFWEDAIDTAAQPNRSPRSARATPTRRARADDPSPTSPARRSGRRRRSSSPTSSPSRGSRTAVEAGHTYVKIWGNDGPDVRFCAGALGADGECSLDPDPPRRSWATPLRAASTELHAPGSPSAGPGAARPGLYTLLVFKDGVPVLEVPITSDDSELRVPELRPGPLPAPGDAPRDRRRLDRERLEPDLPRGRGPAARSPTPTTTASTTTPTTARSTPTRASTTSTATASETPATPTATATTSPTATTAAPTRPARRPTAAARSQPLGAGRLRAVADRDSAAATG